MLDKKLMSYALLGYICAAYLELPTMAIALVGTFFALITFYANQDKDSINKTETKNDKESYHDLSNFAEEDFSNGI